MTNLEILKQKIIEANQAYRIGNPIMDDQTFDDLCDTYQGLVSPEEWKIFRNSLHEKEGKIPHPFIMGSLDKIKIEDISSLNKFLKKYIKNSLNVSAKVDGMSCRLEYENGKLIGASSRGDGWKGENLNDKIDFVKRIPKEIPIKENINIRGELVIFKSDFEKMVGFANPRNATTGLMGKKDWMEEEIHNVSFVAYCILGEDYTKEEQFSNLEKWGFYTAWNKTISKEDCGKDTIQNELLGIAEMAASDLDYETDGLVVSDSFYRNENEYRPDGQMAVKINQQKAVAKLIDIEWQGPSKDGRFVPLAIIEPTEIGGTIVSKASMHNAAFMMGLNVRYGCFVEVCKRGDIIPQIERVVEND